MTSRLRRIGRIACALLLCAGCSAKAEHEADFSAPPTSVVEGTVRIQPASRQFIKVETVPDHGLPALVRAPGRVAFEDGAVARVAAPVQGRVLVVHARQGTRVKRGEPLVTLS